MRGRWLPPAAAVTLVVGSGCSDVRSDAGSGASGPSRSATEIHSLEDIGVLGVIGLDDQGRNSALAKPMDAVFFGELVLVLDASAPWIRVFDRAGRYLDSAIPSGDGPGETVRPYDLDAGSDTVVVAHARGIMASGTDLTFRSVAGPPARFRGVEVACGGELMTLLNDPGIPRSSAIGTLTPGQALVDTIFEFSPVRLNSRTYHPWFVTEVGDDRMIVYPEEEGRHRLVELGCDGAEYDSFALDSLGPGETVDIQGERIAVTRPRPPWPAGLGHVENVLIWMTRDLLPAGDSVTHVYGFDRDGRSTLATLAGWYTLFDVSSDGVLLLANSWTDFMRWDRGATWGSTPGVFLVEGARLLSLLTESEQVGPAGP